MTGPSCPKIHDAIERVVQTLGLPRGAAVLDAPCGGGELALALNACGFTVSGADICSDLIPAAQTLLDGRFHLADLNGPLPWPDASFDLVVSAEGVEHLENPFAMLREAHRICRPGGYLIITTPNLLSLRSRMRYFGSGFYTQDPRPLPEAAPHPLHHIGLRTFWEWRYALHTAGFRLTLVSHTHAKPAGYLYTLFAPWMRLYTRLAFRKEKDPAQREINRAIARQLGSYSLLFGENLLLAAQR